MPQNAVIITGPGFQDHDVIYTYYRLLEEGWNVDVATKNGAPATGKYGVPLPMDKTAQPLISFGQLDPANYNAVILTGGHEAPDRVRQDRGVLDFRPRNGRAGQGRRRPVPRPMDHGECRCAPRPPACAISVRGTMSSTPGPTWWTATSWLGLHTVYPRQAGRRRGGRLPARARCPAGRHPPPTNSTLPITARFSTSGATAPCGISRTARN